MNKEQGFPRTYTNLQVLGAICAILGVLCLIPYASNLEQLYRGYLTGWVFLVSLSVGCLGLTLLQGMVRAQWGVPVVRIYEAGAKILPLLGVASLPIVYAVFTHHLYPWANPAEVAKDSVLRWRAPYMNAPFFFLRTIFYFLVLSWFAFQAVKLRRLQDETGDVLYENKLASFSAPAFVFSVLLVTFAITDWVMTLDKHWYSTIYGFYFCISSALTAHAFAVFLVCRQKIKGYTPYDKLITPQRTKDLGNLMLVMTMVWAYFAVSQFIITWSGDLPYEIEFYLRRNTDFAFATFTTFLVIFHFFVPFLLLLSGRTKRVPALLAMTATIQFLACLVDIVWNVEPMFHSLNASFAAQFQGFLSYLGGFLLLGGLWLVLFVFNLRRNRLVPLYTAGLPTEVLETEVLQHAS